MLQHLSIQNVALIRSLSLALGQGLNVLSGETGAGKSILIDAVNLVLGVRGDRDLIQHGAGRAMVEAVFIDARPEINACLEEMGIEPDAEITLSRVLYATGRNVCRINGVLVNNAALRQIAELLIDIHGQHEHQSLLRTAEHIGLLDAFGGKKIAAQRQEVGSLLEKAKHIRKEIENIGGMGEDRERRLDVLRFQINEIERAAIQENEDELLKKERQQLMNGEKIATAYAYVLNCLANEEGQGAVTLLRDASREIRSVAKWDEKAAQLADQLEEAFFAAEAASDEIRLMQDAFDYDPQRLDQIGERLDELQTLKRKYGGTLEAVQQTLAQAYEQLDALQNADQILQRLSGEYQNILHLLYEKSVGLHQMRKKVAAAFEKSVTKELGDLGMQRARFAVQFKQLPAEEQMGIEQFTAQGLDEVEFMLSANPGEPLKPLAKVASGGEASRIMLALKNIAARLDGIDCLIFDEVDTGISGRMAQVVAEKMAAIARTRQVICVTHLAQLASMADVHYLIEKQVKGDATQTMVQHLTPTQRTQEVARLLGGEGQSGHGLLHAEEMIAAADAYKKSLAL